MLLTALKYALETLTGTTGKVYGLTAALPCNPAHINNIEVDKLTTILTEVSFWVAISFCVHCQSSLLMLHFRSVFSKFNLMSYDLHGAWDNVTGTNAPLYYQGFGDEEWNIHRCVENYLALGVPREKISKFHHLSPSRCVFTLSKLTKSSKSICQRYWITILWQIIQVCIQVESAPWRKRRGQLA